MERGSTISGHSSGNGLTNLLPLEAAVRFKGGNFQIYAPINGKPQGEGVGHGVGILTFSFKIIQIPTPRTK